ncbi:MAG: phage tail sheath subtilisin-like domain-containing protein [Candidatus Promineifilaceae bacterium]
MAEYLAPGVYVEEIEAGPKPIEGVSTSTTGMVGMTARGPADGLPKLVTSFAEYRRRFGGYLDDAALDGYQYLPYAVRGFFENGGKRVYIKRVLDTGTADTAGTAAAASPPVGGIVTRLAQNATATATTIRLISLRGIENASTIDLSQTKNGTTTTESVTVASYTPGTKTVTLTAALANDFEAKYTSVTITSIADPGTPLELEAADPGAWGNGIHVQVFHTSAASAAVQAIVTNVVANDTVQLSTGSGFYAGAIVEFDLGQSKVYAQVTAVNGRSITVATPFGATTDLDPDAGTTTTMARTCEFRLVVSYDGVTEDYDGLSLNDTTSRYYQTVINNVSTLVRVPSTVVADTTTEDPFTQPSAADGLTLALAGGLDGSAPSDADYVGVDNGPGQRTGIAALADIDEVSLVAAPGMVSQTIQNALIAHCELLLDRFAVLDPDYASNNALENIQDQRNLYDTKYAALYFPNIKAFDPLTGGEIVLPPSGHVLGLYAKTDIERGVHKAPANVVVGSITGLDLTINKGEQDILNPRNINVIRDFRASGRGYRVWGARCLTSDSQWKYVPVRRLFIFVEESLDEGLQWVVFEPNAEPLWARVRQSISNFLVRVWRDGALMGATPEEAYFVRCDRTTMTQDDIDNGRLIILVGIAPVKPAEFVIVRIQQYTAEANV